MKVHYDVRKSNILVSFCFIAKKEEKKKPEPESESDDDMGFGLFD